MGPLIILLGGGKDNADEGFKKFMALRKRRMAGGRSSLLSGHW